MYTIDADRLTIRDLIAMQKASGDIADQIPILRKWRRVKRKTV